MRDRTWGERPTVMPLSLENHCCTVSARTPCARTLDDRTFYIRYMMCVRREKSTCMKCYIIFGMNSIAFLGVAFYSLTSSLSCLRSQHRLGWVDSPLHHRLYKTSSKLTHLVLIIFLFQRDFFLVRLQSARLSNGPVSNRPPHNARLERAYVTLQLRSPSNILHFADC